MSTKLETSDIKNLRALVNGVNLSPQQHADAMGEFDKLVTYTKSLEKIIEQENISQDKTANNVHFYLN